MGIDYFFLAKAAETQHAKAAINRIDNCRIYLSNAFSLLGSPSSRTSLS